MSDEKTGAPKKPDTPFDVAELVENAFMLGIGVLELGREKTSDFANELIERGKLSQGDAKRVADRISEIAQEQQEQIRDKVATETGKARATAGMATKADVDALRAEIAEIKALLAEKTGAAPVADPFDVADE